MIQILIIKYFYAHRVVLKIIDIEKENKKLKKELNVLKANFRYDGKIYNEIDLFEKFKNEYLTYKSQATKLKDENSALLKKLNFKMYNNLLIRKNIEIQIISKVNIKKYLH